METHDKSFLWLCHVLSQARARLPVIETIFLHKDEIALWVRCTKSGKVKKQPVTDLPDKSSSLALQHFMEVCDAETPGSSAVCFLSVKGTRVLIDWERLEDPATVHNLFVRSTMAQGILDENESPLVFTLRLSLSNREYISEFRSKRAGLNEEVKSTRIWCKALSHAKVIFATIEKIKKQVVDAAEFEFILGDSGDVYLYGCTSMRLVTPKQPRQDTAAYIEKRDLCSLKELPPVQYRIGTPLHRTTTCIRTLDEGDTWDGKACSEATSPRGAGAAAFLPRVPRQSAFSNPNFLELVALNWAKNHAMPTYSLEEAMKCMESECLQDKAIETFRPREQRSIGFENVPLRKSDEGLIRAESQCSALSTTQSKSRLKTTVSLASISEKSLARRRLDPVLIFRRRAQAKKCGRKYVFKTLKS